MDNDEKINEKLKEIQLKALGYLKKQDFDKAIAIYLDVLKEYKDSDYAHQVSYSNLGVIYLNLQKPDLAEDYMKRALSYSPLQPEYHRILGTVYIMTKRPKEAVKEFRICVKHNPENEEYLKMLALALHDAGRKNEALEILGRINLFPTGAAGLMAAKAAEYLVKGNLQKASKLAEKAKLIDPQNKLVKEVVNALKNEKKAGPSAKPAETISADSVYQIKVQLKGIKPPIWRRFQVSGNVSLYKLHLVLQALMGWQNYHLFEFEIRNMRFSIPNPDDDIFENARRNKLNQVILEEKTKFLYIYDFGDGWEHELIVEKITPAEQKLKYPVCLGGKRAGPPEDSGGIGGYAEYLEILGTPPPDDPDKEDPETREMRQWIGVNFDPEYFDLEEINRKLRKIKI